MDPALLISPHLDDCLLSCGQLIAGRPDCVVATVFAGTPARGRMLTSYDKDCGFRSASHAMTVRRFEDAKAVALLDGTTVHLDFTDGQYGQDVAPSAIVEALLAETNRENLSVIVGPLGLAHPDHHTVRRAFHAVLAERPDLQGWLYEDMPGRVWWPEQVPDALAWWAGMGYTPTLGFLGTGDLDRKREAVECYRSQLWALGEGLHAVLVPERFRRLDRS